MSTATASRIVRILGLTGQAEIASGLATFPLGLLYPYSAHLQQVCECYDRLCEESEDAADALAGERARPPGPVSASEEVAIRAFLTSIATLYSHIAFAPGPAAAAVNAAFLQANEVLVPADRR